MEAMVRPKPTVLVVVQGREARAVFHGSLGAICDVRMADGVEQARELLRADREEFAVVISDHGVRSGVELLGECTELAPDALRILLSDTQLSEIHDALGGALYSFVSKPVDPVTIRLIVDRACEHHALMRRTDELEARLDRQPKEGGEATSSSELVGESPDMVAVRALIDVIGPAGGAVLITGESGTGKELAARALHRAGRRGRPFVGINCAALPRDLIESELFGFERGTFTGASGRREGLMRAAGEGTLFLDEVTEMPLELQPKLLRALEERAVRPLGGRREVPLRARLLSSTNRNPAEAVETGQLRTDLFYRLCVFRIDLPPLRNHPEDIPLLIKKLEPRLGLPSVSLSADALAILRHYSWPGNVRELRNVVEHAATMSRSGHVEVEHLPAHIRKAAKRIVSLPTPEPEQPLMTLAAMERVLVYRALEHANGNKAAAARMLGISRHQLYTRLQHFAKE